MSKIIINNKSHLTSMLLVLLIMNVILICYVLFIKC